MHNPSTRLLATWWMRYINLNLKKCSNSCTTFMNVASCGGWVPYCKEICSKVFQCLKLKIHLRIVHNLSSLRLLSQILKGLKRGFNNLFDFQKLLNRYRIEKWIHKSFPYLRSKNFVHNDGRSNHVFSCGNINDYIFSIWGEGSSDVRSLWMIHFHHIHQTVKCSPSFAHPIVFPFSM